MDSYRSNSYIGIPVTFYIFKTKSVQPVRFKFEKFKTMRIKHL